MREPAQEDAREAGRGPQQDREAVARQAGCAGQRVRPRGTATRRVAAIRMTARDNPSASASTRSDTIADRRGRAMPVTRSPQQEKPERPVATKHRGKPRRPDRSRAASNRGHADARSSADSSAGARSSGPKSQAIRPDRRPDARVAVQHPHPCLWRSDRGRARARPVRRHRRARPRGAVARRGFRPVRG